MSQYQHNWNRKSLDELVEFYNETIAPRMVADGLEPRTEPPTYQWLVDNGLSGLADTLRNKHDLTLTEFYADVVGVGSRDSDYGWGISSESMIEVFEQYFEGRKTRGNLAERTLRSRRSRLATFARTYESLHGHSDLERHLDDTYERPNEIGRCLAVFDVLNEQLANDETKLKYYSEIRQFYEYLENLRRAQYNPVEPVSDQYDWERGKPDNPTVDKEGMRCIYLEADDLSQEMLVLALGAWGLRPAEVASLHSSQFVFDTDTDDTDDYSDDYIQFEERKNGPGTVSLMYGVEAVQTRIDELADDDWNGYLFPSKQSLKM